MSDAAEVSRRAESGEDGGPRPGSHPVPQSASDEVVAWLDRRTPSPPPALRERVAALVRASQDAGATTTPEMLVGAVEQTLRALLDGDPKRRESALDLLAADALVTYGFEAAADDPQLIEPLARRAMARLSALAEGA